MFNFKYILQDFPCICLDRSFLLDAITDIDIYLKDLCSNSSEKPVLENILKYFIKIYEKEIIELMGNIFLLSQPKCDNGWDIYQKIS